MISLQVGRVRQRLLGDVTSTKTHSVLINAKHLFKLFSFTPTFDRCIRGLEAETLLRFQALRIPGFQALRVPGFEGSRFQILRVLGLPLGPEHQFTTNSLQEAQELKLNSLLPLGLNHRFVSIRLKNIFQLGP